MRILGGILLVALLLAGCGSSDQQATKSAPASPPASTSESGEWEATPSEPPQMTRADVLAAPAIAYEFLKKFSPMKDGVTRSQWHEDVEALATPDLAAQIALMDPVDNRNSLPSQPWGKPEKGDVISFDVDRLVVKVPTGPSSLDDLKVTIVKYAGDLLVSGVDRA